MEHNVNQSQDGGELVEERREHGFVEDLLIIEEKILDTKGKAATKMSGKPPNLSKLTAPVYKCFTWDDEKSLWICNTCSKKYVHHGHSGSATLNKHMELKHPKVLEAAKALTTAQSGKEQQTLMSHVVPSKPPPPVISQTGVSERLIKFIITTDQPFNICENQEFLDLMKYISRDHKEVIVPRRKTLRTMIHARYEEEKEKLKRELQENEGRISLITDCWTSKNQIPYHGVLACWIDNNWVMNTTLLDLSILEGPHTGENLSKELGDLLTKFDLWKKVMSVTTDNASNMDTMFQHIDRMSEENGSRFLSKDHRVRCLAHVVNLACRAMLDSVEGNTISASNLEDDIDNINDGTGELNCGGILAKVRRGVSAIRSSPQRRALLKASCTKYQIKYKNLIYDMKVRWNSTLDMLTRLQELRLAYDDVLESNQKLRQHLLSEADWIVISTLIDALEPFKQATLWISKQRPTLPDTSAVYHILFNHLEVYIDNEPRNESEPASKRPRRHEQLYPDWLINCSKAAWDKLKQYYPSCDSMISIAGTVLDPRLKLKWFQAIGWDKESQDKARKQVERLWSQYAQGPRYRSNLSGSVTGASAQAQSSSNPSVGKGDLFDELFADKMKKFHKVDDELKRYLNENVETLPPGQSILDWWKCHENRFKLLSKMAKDVHSAQGTGVSIERFFSSGPDLLTCRRQRLSAESIKECLSLKCWLRRNKCLETDEIFGNSLISKVLGEDADEIVECVDSGQ